jgi:hypothetical protein
MIGNFRIEGKDEGILNAVEQNLGLANGARRRIASIVLIKGHHRERYYEKGYEGESRLFIKFIRCFHDDFRPL